MASTDKQLEEQLFEAGNKLADPPSSVEELLSLLDVTPFPSKSYFNYFLVLLIFIVGVFYFE